MPKYKDINGKTYRMVIVRFRNQNDLDKFSEKLGYQAGYLTNYTSEVLVPGGIIKSLAKLKKPRVKDGWKKTWAGQPYFYQQDVEAYSVIRFYFDPEIYETDYIARLLEQSITDATTSTWYPKQDVVGAESYLRVIGGTSETHFPVYVVSKSRADCCLTSKFLEMCEVKHYVVVEEYQKNDYMQTVGQSPYVTILTIPQKYFDEYETLYDFKDEPRLTGPGAARNFCWQHSMANGFYAHHVLDDNIRGFHMLSDNCKIKVRTGAFIRAMEEHFMAFDNVALGGPCYTNFAPKNENRGCHIFNTRIYSWILIRNDIWNQGFKWRGTWNEDSILSLDVLKAGWATIQYYIYLQNKVATQSLAGGNTDEFYAREGTLRKSQMLVDVHPDVSQLKYKFGRIHHEVNYRPFASNDPQFRPERLQQGTNDYGMYVVKIDEEDDHTKNQLLDSKSALEAKYTEDKAVYKWDGTRWQDGFDLVEDYNEKGY